MSSEQDWPRARLFGLLRGDARVLGLVLTLSGLLLVVDLVLLFAFGEAIVDRNGQRDLPWAYVMPLAGGFVAWGFLRAWRLNPATTSDYLAWLRTSPWTIDRALPFGPVRLTTADAMPVALAAALAVFPPHSLLLAAAYLAAYATTLLVVSARHGECEWAAAGGAAMAAVPWAAVCDATSVVPWRTAVCLLVAVPCGQLAWRRILPQIASAQDATPWRPIIESQQAILDRQRRAGVFVAEWPLTQPWEDAPQHGSERMRKLMTAALLLAWAAGASIAFSNTLQQQSNRSEWNRTDWHIASLNLGLVTTAALAVLRTVTYLQRCRPPLWLWSRLRTGRLIDPNFDRVLIAPLVTLAVGWGIAALAYRLHWPPVLAAFETVALAALAAFCLPPSLANWRSTGGYRMATGPPLSQRTNRASREPTQRVARQEVRD
ncbi:MAG: hypothetical protein CMJ58_21415 [Planctomycetaceae bacterium]|nr:hypothetical protein [Planctomycetaceae bacterium]